MAGIISLAQSGTDALRIVTANAQVTVTRQDIANHVAANVTQTLAQTEQWIVDTVAAIDTSYDLRVHITTLSPLSIAVMTCEKGYVPNAGWWQ